MLVIKKRLIASLLKFPGKFSKKDEEDEKILKRK